MRNMISRVKLRMLTIILLCYGEFLIIGGQEPRSWASILPWYVSNTLAGEESTRPDMKLRPEQGWVDKGPTADLFDTLCYWL